MDTEAFVTVVCSSVVLSLGLSSVLDLGTTKVADRKVGWTLLVVGAVAVANLYRAVVGG